MTIVFLFDKFDMLHFVNLRCTAWYFNTFMYCNRIAIEAIFVALHGYSILLLFIFIILCIRSLWLIYY